MFFIIISVVYALMALYVIFRLIRPLNIHAGIKVVLAAFILLMSQKMLAVGFGHVILPDFNPYSFGFASLTGFMQVFIFVLFVCAVGADVLTFILNRFHCRFLWKKTIVWGIATVVCISGFYEAMKVPEINKVTVQSDLLPLDWKPIHVAVLSDLHIGSTDEVEKNWLAETVMETNAMKPDVIFITGDLIDGPVSLLKEQMQPLFDLKAKEGVYIVFGNHETYRGAASWQDFFEEKGIPVLNDKITQITVGENPIRLAGIYQNPDLLKNETSTPSALFLLAHYPAIAQKVPADTVAVQFSGHTHGGQFGLLLRPIIAMANAGFVKGVYKKGKSIVYVNSGTGLWRGFPFRFLTPSEITFMTIERPNATID